MKKILVVITTGFVSWGGLTTAYMNYYRVLDKENLLIDFASMNEVEEDLKKEIGEEGGCYYQLSDKRKKPFRYLLDLNRLLGKNHYDVIHVHGNSATMAGELVLARYNKVLVRIAHCHTSQVQHPIMNQLLLPFFIRSYTVGIACSKVAGDWLYPNGTFEIFHNVINTVKYRFNADHRNHIRKLYKIEDKFVIGHVGKLYEAKNHRFLLEIFKEIYSKNQDVILLLVGDGHLREELEEWVDRSRLNEAVIFAGMQDNAAPFYCGMDVFLFPSLYEGFGLAAVEAQCSGLLCVLSNSLTRETKIAEDTSYIELEKRLWVEEATRKLCQINQEFRSKRSNEAIHQIEVLGLSDRKEARKLRALYLAGEEK